MQTEQRPLQEAKNKFSAVVDAARQGEAQVVTQRRAPVVGVLSIEKFQKFQKVEAAQSLSLADHLLGMPAGDGEFSRINPINPV